MYLPENQTVSKSNNQGVKEEMLIQMGVPWQRNMEQIKAQIKTPEKELSNEEIANLSGVEFKTLVIRTLTEMIEFGCKLRKK